MFSDNIITVPERAAGFGDDVHASRLGCFHDDSISLASIGIGIFFKDQMGYLPGLEELGEHGLRCFPENEELGLGVELGDTLGQIMLAVQSIPSC